MSASPRILLSYLLMLQFSLFSSVDVWAMTVPAETPPSAEMAREASSMGMTHCQDAQKKQCRCVGCACIPLVVGLAVQAVVLSVMLERGVSDFVPYFYEVPRVPPFRPPII